MADSRVARPLIHSTELSEYVKMDGALSTERSLLLKGCFTGSIKSSSHVTIDRGAVVESCALTARSLSVSGRLSGSVRVEAGAELRDKASVSADIEAGTVSISDTAGFEGQIRMPGFDD